MAKLYIAYGSNMDEEQMAYRCPSAKLVGVCLLQDWRLMFKGSLTGAYATIEKAEGFRVPALFWKITKEDEKHLDHYEGYPTFYYKKNIEVLLPDKTLKKGMAYVMHEERKFGTPSAHYVQILADAYEKFAFDRRILQEAWDYSYQKSEDDYYAIGRRKSNC
jgi:hypothetical protein